MVPPAEPRVRPATLRDARELARLAGELGYPASAAEIEARLPLLAGEAHLVLVAALPSEGGAPEALAGWIHVQIVVGLTGPPCAEIAGLIVDARRRSAGLGRQLVRHAEAWTRARGLSSLRVRSRDVRERAHAFYRGLGFRDVKKQLQLALELAPAVPAPGNGVAAAPDG